MVISTEGLQPQTLSLLGKGSRLAAQFDKTGSDLVLSYLLFQNATGSPTSDGCREAVIGPVLENLKGKAEIEDVRRSARKVANGKTLSVAEYTIAKAGEVPLGQLNVFGFYGDAQTCFEIHVSKPRFAAADRPAFDEAVNAFDFEPGYRPTAAEYGLVGTLFFNYIHDFKAAAVYYQRALDTLPKAEVTAPTASVLGRVTVTQLAMSYGMAGDLARSRAVNEAAIGRDPEFPMPYYNLACADAEAGDAAAAKVHLQQAFERRQHMLPGVAMPDPTQDDSILKLKSDPQFWAFVQSLPKS